MEVDREGINALCFTCSRIRHKMETYPHVVREDATGPNMEQNASIGDTSNEQMAVGKDTEKNKLEDYGEWMVVSRRKSKGRMVSRPQQLDQSQMSEVSSKASSIAMPRVAEQYKRDGKSKATHTQPVMSYREIGKTSDGAFGSMEVEGQ